MTPHNIIMWGLLCELQYKVGIIHGNSGQALGKPLWRASAAPAGPVCRELGPEVARSWHPLLQDCCGGAMGLFQRCAGARPGGRAGNHHLRRCWARSGVQLQPMAQQQQPEIEFRVRQARRQDAAEVASLCAQVRSSALAKVVGVGGRQSQAQRGGPPWQGSGTAAGPACPPRSTACPARPPPTTTQPAFTHLRACRPSPTATCSSGSSPGACCARCSRCAAQQTGRCSWRRPWTPRSRQGGLCLDYHCVAFPLGVWGKGLLVWMGPALVGRC